MATISTIDTTDTKLVTVHKSPKYKVDKHPPFNTLGFMTFVRTYARRLFEDDKNSPVESWQQCIERVVESCNSQLKCNYTEEEQKEYFDLLYNLKCLVGGRFLWQLGTKTVDRLGLLSLQNCTFVNVDSIQAFTYTFDALMLGAGVGYNLLPEKVYTLPVVKKADIERKDINDADFIVPDSREGWVKLLGKVLKAHFYSGKGFTYSLHCIRSRGTPIKTFGGLASGPNVLHEGIQQIHDIFNSRAGNKMRPIDCLDVLNIIGKVVVSGNVRRCIPEGARVYMEDGIKNIEDVEIGDYVMVRSGLAKKVTNTWYQGKQELVRITTDDGYFDCTPNHKMAILSSEGKNEWKEAGLLTSEDTLLVYTNNKRWAECSYGSSYDYVSDDIIKSQLNIARRMLKHFGTFSLIAEAAQVRDTLLYMGLRTIIIPDEGDYFLEEIANDGKCKVISVESIGSEETFDIEVEDYHEFYCNGYLTHNSAQIALGDVKDLDYLRAKRWDLGNIPTWRCYSNNSIICNDIKELPEEFWDGYQGNGEPYGLININLARSCGRTGDTKYTDEKVDGVNPCSEITLESYECCCLAEIFLPHITSKEELLKVGKYCYRTCKHSLSIPCHVDAVNEVIKRNYRIGIGVTGYLMATEEQKSWLSDVYEELREFDENYSKERGYPMSRKITTTKPSGCMVGSTLISTTKGLLRLDEIGDTKGEQWQEIKDLFVYDENGEKRKVNKFYVNGRVPTKIVKTRKNTLEMSLQHRVRVIDKNRNYVWKEGKDLKVGDKLYVSISQDTEKSCDPFSCMDFIVFNEHSVGHTIKVNYELLRKSDRNIVRSFFLKFIEDINRINPADFDQVYQLGLYAGLVLVRRGDAIHVSDEKDFFLDKITKIEDSENETFDIEVDEVHHYIAQGVVSHNTLSLLGGVTPGCHPAYSKCYIRRVRFASDSPLLPVLQKNGYYMEYVQQFDGSLDYSTKVVEFPIEVPDGTIVAKDMTAIKQLEVVKRLQTEWADNSVSVTVYYKKEELPEIKEWLNKYYNTHIKAVSFLLHSDHGFKQAPYEEITKEKYDEMASKVKEIYSLDDYSNVSDDLNVECAGGACPIK